MVSANANSIAQKFRYNGKELNDELGLDWYDYHARSFDPSLGRMMNIDPHADSYYGISPYNYTINNPVLLVDPDGKDAIVTIDGNQITVSTNIYIYGSGATEETKNRIQKYIDKIWGGDHKYTDENGNEYEVKFETSVEFYDEEDPTNNPLLIPESFNPSNTDNFIEVIGDGESGFEGGRSNVSGGDEGVWYKRTLNSQLSKGTFAHEFGHLLGLKDRYSNTDEKDDSGRYYTKPNPGWEDNIMGNNRGKVDQRNIDGVVKESVQKYNKYVQKYGNEKAKKSVYTTKIDVRKVRN